MVTELRDAANDLIYLILHLALCNTHSIDEHSVVDLLLPDAFVVSLQVLMLDDGTILRALQPLDFVLPSLPLLLFLL